MGKRQGSLEDVGGLNVGVQDVILSAWTEVIPRKVRRPKRPVTLYREGKLAAHSTVGGKGLLRRIAEKR